MKMNKYFDGDPYWIVPHKIKLDEKIAQFNPPKAASEYESLKSQIQKDGQIDPAYIRNGLLGDGRHRMQIAQELGTKLLVQDINSSMPDEDYIKLCNKNTFGTRNDDATQLALKAYALIKEYGYTQKAAMQLCGVTDKNAIGYIRYIADSKYVAVIDQLKNTKDKVEIKDSTGKIRGRSRSLRLIRTLISTIEEEELLIVDDSAKIEDIKIDYNDYLNTEAAKEVFWSTIGHNTTVPIETKKLWCELLNLKYKLKDVK